MTLHFTLNYRVICPRQPNVSSFASLCVICHQCVWAVIAESSDLNDSDKISCLAQNTQVVLVRAQVSANHGDHCIYCNSRLVSSRDRQEFPPTFYWEDAGHPQFSLSHNVYVFPPTLINHSGTRRWHFTGLTDDGGREHLGRAARQHCRQDHTGSGHKRGQFHLL